MATHYRDLALQEDLNLGVDTGTRRNPAGGTLVGTQIGLHSFARGKAKTITSWTPGAVAAGSSVSTTITVPGAALTDFAEMAFSLDLQGLFPAVYVSAPNTVTIVLANLTGSVVTLGGGSLAVLVFEARG